MNKLKLVVLAGLIFISTACSNTDKALPIACDTIANGIDIAITYQDKLPDSTLKKIDNIRQLSRPYCLYLEKTSYSDTATKLVIGLSNELQTLIKDIK